MAINLIPRWLKPRARREAAMTRRNRRVARSPQQLIRPWPEDPSVPGVHQGEPLRLLFVIRAGKAVAIGSQVDQLRRAKIAHALAGSRN